MNHEAIRRAHIEHAYGKHTFRYIKDGIAECVICHRRFTSEQIRKQNENFKSFGLKIQIKET